MDNIKTLTLPSRYGLITIPTDDAIIGRSLSTYGEWAQNEIDVLCDFIKEGDTVLDVGACFGTHSLAFSERVGPSGRVIAFEASPKNFLLLERNCQNRRGGPVELIQAVVAGDGRANFFVRNDDENRGGTSFVATPSPVPTSDPGQDGVRSLAIDSLNLDRVDFIKIDVEGMESEVVGGALETLRRYCPFIFFEVNFVEEGRNTIERLKNSDYRFFGLLSEAFNPDNFFGSTERIFGEGRECGVLAVPNVHHSKVDEFIRARGLASIETADDLALLLMNKPQYVRSDITREKAARSLKVPAIVASVGGNDQHRREFAELRDEKSALERELTKLNALNQNSQSELQLLRTEKSVLEREFALLNALNQTLQNELQLLRTEKSAIEREFAAVNALNQTAQNELQLLRTEVSARDRDFAALTSLNQTLEQELQLLRDEQEQDKREIERRDALLSMARTLARRAGKFPFALYFRKKRKYQPILNAFQSAPVSANPEPASKLSHDGTEEVS